MNQYNASCLTTNDIVISPVHVNLQTYQLVDISPKILNTNKSSNKKKFRTYGKILFID
jgi:hypothetical protein